MSPQQSIAHYRIVSKLGEGGMGAVYRATDTKLNRDVAIKILPPAFAEDAARMQRFEREAQVLASLNHPNIAAIYGIEQGAIVMELVEGDDLRGPVPLDTAIACARQIVAGLEAAHEKGIVHRDLKPANIKVTPDGIVKLLDFGLAKATEAVGAPASPTISPTLSLTMTQSGMILGTAAYMSPEQARGKPVDKRADIWAFGVVFYEMLTGRQLFGAGDTITDVIASVLTREPDWSALPAHTPPHIRRLLERCLRKDPKLRLRDIGEARIALDEPAPPAPAATQRNWWPWAIAAAALAALAVTLALRTPAPQGTQFLRVAEDPPEPIATVGVGTSFALSPDGSRVVYVTGPAGGQAHLVTRKLDQQTPVALARTEGANSPFFSLDGRWIGYTTGEGLFKIPADGGSPVRICVLRVGAGIRGATWLDADTIVFGTAAGPLQRVPAKGGEATALTRVEPDEGGHRWPAASPDGSHIVFMVDRFDSPGGPSLISYSLRDGQRKTILEDGGFPHFLPSGELAFVRAGTLYAAPIDRQYQTTAEPRPILRDIAAVGATGASQLALSATGTAAYIPGWIDTDRLNLIRLYPDGRQTVLGPILGGMAPRLSPDGKRVAYGVGKAILRSANDYYVRDLERGTTTRVTNDSKGKRIGPLWTPDGRYLLYGGRDGVYQAPADGSSPPHKILDGDWIPSAFTRDGKFLLLADANGTLRCLRHPHSRGGSARHFAGIAFRRWAQLPPSLSRWEGRLYAHAERPGDRADFRPPAAISDTKPRGFRSRYLVAAGDQAVWSRAGLKLYFPVGGGTQIMLVNCAVHEDKFHCDSPRPWSDHPRIPGSGSFDVAADGSILALTPAEVFRAGSARIHFLFHFDPIAKGVAR